MRLDDYKLKTTQDLVDFLDEIFEVNPSTLSTYTLADIRNIVTDFIANQNKNSTKKLELQQLERILKNKLCRKLLIV